MKLTSCQKQRIRSFVKEYKKGVELTRKGVKVSPTWDSDFLDLKGLRSWFVRGLHRKINEKGGVKQEYRDDLISLWRDCQIYNAWQKKQKTQWGLRFYSKYFKKRFSFIELQMKEYFDDRF